MVAGGGREGGGGWGVGGCGVGDGVGRRTWGSNVVLGGVIVGGAGCIIGGVGGLGVGVKIEAVVKSAGEGGGVFEGGMVGRET